MLKKRNLIESGPSKLGCGEKFGQGHCYLGLGKCALQIAFQTVQYFTFLTAATHACTKTDPDTGEAIHTFETPYTTAHRIGGFIAVTHNLIPSVNHKGGAIFRTGVGNFQTAIPSTVA